MDTKSVKLNIEMINRLMEAQCLTQEGLADEAGVAVGTVRNLFRGECVYRETHLRIAKALGVEPRELLLPPLAAELDVRVWRAGDTGRLVSKAGTLPVRRDDLIRIEVGLNRPAHLYLAWITSEGEAQPLHPWIPPDWDKLQPSEAVARLQLPEETAWSINTSSGLETVVLMARETPLPESDCSKLPTLLAGFPRGVPVQDGGRCYWFEYRPSERSSVEATRDFTHRTVPDDPIRQIHCQLRDRLGPLFSVVRAVSFANQG